MASVGICASDTYSYIVLVRVAFVRATWNGHSSSFSLVCALCIWPRTKFFATAGQSEKFCAG